MVLQSVNFFHKESKSNKKKKKTFYFWEWVGREGGGGAKVSDFFLQRIQI